MTLLLREQVPLAPHTTLGLGGPARYFYECTTEAELVDALTWARERRLRVQIMGGGSNLVVADAGFPGLVLKLAIGGVAPHETTQGVELTAAAGVEWDALVRSEEHTSELQSRLHLVCRLLLEKKKTKTDIIHHNKIIK